jgi:hypothetical protein
MATIRINALPEAVTPVASQNVAIDGAQTQRTTIQGLVDTGAPVPSEAEARAGADNSKRMTSLRVKQSIDEQVNVTIASAAQGALAAGAAQKADNLSDIVDKASARGNMTLPTYVADRTALKALDTTKDTLVFLKEAGREGQFKWTAGDYSTQITADTLEGRYIKADAIAATSGAWIRQEVELVTKWYGASGSGDKRTEMQAALRAADGTRELTIAESVQLSGDVILPANSRVSFDPSATFDFNAYSSTGSLTKTVDPTIGAAASIKDNIKVENFRADGTNYPGPFIFEIVSGTTTTLVLPATDKNGNATSSVDDFYNGRFLLFMDGVNASALVSIDDYVGSTRTATLSTLISAPTAGDDVQIGWNDNLMASVGGVTNIHVDGGVFKNLDQLKMVPSIGGGKGINFESGVTNGSILGGTFENLNQAVFIQGLDGTNPAPNSSKKRTVGIRAGNYYAKNVGSVLTIAGLNADQSPDGDADDQMVIASNIVYENAGYAPYRIVGSDQQKSGIINLMEAQNVSIFNVRGRNDSNYPVVPADPAAPNDYAARVGFGFTGPVGAMLWGHARHLRINGFIHHGNVDAMIRVQRVRALGDDATGQSGRPRNCYGWFIDGMECHGTAGYVIALDPEVTRQVPASQLTGRIQVVVGTLSSGICDPAMATFENIILDVTERSSGKRVVGTPKEIIAAGNTVASFLSSDLHPVFLTGSIADDTIFTMTPPKSSGFMKWCIVPGGAGGAGFSGRIYYNLTSSAICEDAGIPSLVALGTAALTNGTGDGVDGSMNVAVVLASGTIILKNRRGSARALQVTFE